MFSLLCARFLQPTLHSNGIEFPAGLHLSESGLHYNKCGCSEISCLTYSCQNGTGERCSAQAPAKDTRTQRGAEQHISSACKENVSQEDSSPCFRKSLGVTRQVPSSIFSGKCISQIPLSIEVHWQPLSQKHPVLSLPKERRQQFFSCS